MQNPGMPLRDEYDGHTTRTCGAFGPVAFLYFEWVERSLIHRWLFKRVERNWDVYWSKIHHAISDATSWRGCADNFGIKRFDIGMNKSGGWIKDDVMFEIQFISAEGKYEWPKWIVAFKKLEVIHVQPVF